MKNLSKFMAGCTCAAGMLVLILDSKTALLGAKDGIHTCISTVIPALFPFLVLSIILNASLIGQRIPFSRAICQGLHIPEEAISIVLSGFLGGYPTGAQNIALAYRSGNLSKKDAERMLAFCNNAGPSFIFGIGSILFQRVWICLIIWLIHIFSALAVGVLTPSTENHTLGKPRAVPCTFPQALSKAISTMGLVCGWVILFRILLEFFDRWFLWMLPETMKYFLCGIIELANGCCQLIELENSSQKFLLFSVLLSFGGICVAMQTHSILSDCDLSAASYLPGKLTQSAISCLLAAVLQFLFPESERITLPPILLIICTGICIGYCIYKRNFGKSIAFRRIMVYNDANFQ